MPKLDIAGIRLELQGTRVGMSRPLTCFSSDFPEESNITIYISNQIANQKNFMDEAMILREEGFCWYHVPEHQTYYVTIRDQDLGSLISVLQVDHRWENASVSYLELSNDITRVLSGPIGEIIFRNRILFHQGIVLHAAAVEWNGRGIIFSAPAGTGKTTQAKLWCRYMGARIMNGDRPALRVMENHTQVYGTPWSGSSDEFRNTSAPLSGIFLLEQAKVNQLIRLSKQEALSYLLPRCFLPYYDSSMMNLAMDNLENLMEKTSVYLLRCRPDREAVEMVYQCIK